MHTSFDWKPFVIAWFILILQHNRASVPVQPELEHHTRQYSDWSWVPMGEIAFADSVLAYDPGALGENTGDEPAEPFNNPSNVLGVPDTDTSSVRHLSLGNGGTVILLFRDNILYDGPGADLCFWMPDPSPEEAVVFISRDNQTFKRAGTISSANPLLDIKGAADPGLFYPIIKIRDNAFQGELDTPDLGADIDAVCAINTCKIHEYSADQLFKDLSTTLQEDAERILQPVIRDIQSHQEVQVLIEIHPESRGSMDFNLLLSQEWARILRDYLQEDLGLDAQFTAVAQAAPSYSYSPVQFINGRVQILIQYKP